MFRFPDSVASAQARTRSFDLTRGREGALAVAILGAATAGIAFGAAGGTELTRTTVVEILMVLLGGALVAASLVWGRRGPLHGGSALLLFALLAALTALSIVWAIVPTLAYVEAGRTLAYLAVFAAAIGAARLAPNAGPVVIKGVTLGAMAVVLYALVARVFPASLAEVELSNRLGQPFGYWNAVGTTAALAIPGLLWLGARRGGSLAGRALAYPAMGAALLAILLTQSRGALAAGLVAGLLWLALVPLRLRSLPVVVLPALAAGAVAAWALSKDAFSVALLPLAEKESVAGTFGLLLFAMLAGLLGVGIALNIALARRSAPEPLRRKAGIAALAAAGLLVLAALVVVSVSDRGLVGTIEDRVDELTSETDTAPTEGAGRITQASSTRSKYWREARLVFEDRPSLGTGAGTFRIARLRHRTDASVTAHAHGFVPQTMADLGLVGVAVSTLLLLAWLAAAARSTALHPRRAPWRLGAGELPARRDWTTERIALVTLALMAFVFGLQSLVDWTWFIPGPAAMALVTAGFVAGRGPPFAAATAADEHAQREGGSAAPDPARLLAAAGVLLAALLCAWAIWQPEASDRGVGEALRLSDLGETESALVEIEEAADANPLSAEPLLVGAAIETGANREADAQATLEEAVLKFPGDPRTWYRLAAFQLGTADRPRAAAETVQGALYLDPLSAPAGQLFLDARARLREKQDAAAERPRP